MVFWIVAAKTCQHWRTALVLVQPDTFVRWHREWLRSLWAHRSRQPAGGRRPSTDGSASYQPVVKLVCEAC
jgi:hypothetical protein